MASAIDTGAMLKWRGPPGPLGPSGKSYDIVVTAWIPSASYAHGFLYRAGFNPPVVFQEDPRREDRIIPDLFDTRGLSPREREKTKYLLDDMFNSRTLELKKYLGTDYWIAKINLNTDIATVIVRDLNTEWVNNASKKRFLQLHMEWVNANFYFFNLSTPDGLADFEQYRSLAPDAHEPKPFHIIGIGNGETNPVVESNREAAKKRASMEGLARYHEYDFSNFDGFREFIARYAIEPYRQSQPALGLEPGRRAASVV